MKKLFLSNIYYVGTISNLGILIFNVYLKYIITMKIYILQYIFKILNDFIQENVNYFLLRIKDCIPLIKCETGLIYYVLILYGNWLLIQNNKTLSVMIN